MLVVIYICTEIPTAWQPLFHFQSTPTHFSPLLLSPAQSQYDTNKALSLAFEKYAKKDTFTIDSSFSVAIHNGQQTQGKSGGNPHSQAFWPPGRAVLWPWMLGTEGLQPARDPLCSTEPATRHCPRPSQQQAAGAAQGTPSAPTVTLSSLLPQKLPLPTHSPSPSCSAWDRQVFIALCRGQILPPSFTRLPLAASPRHSGRLFHQSPPVGRVLMHLGPKDGDFG